VPRVLGIDSSTQSTKVEIRDADDGRLLATGRAPHPETQPPRSEQDPAAWWDALHHAVAAAGDIARDVAAVSVAAQQHGLVALDHDSRVLRPAKLWNDTESAPDAEWLIDRLGGRSAWAAACGSVPVASFTITKLSWLHRTEPDVWARLAHVCLPHDWLTARLAGELVTDRGDASGTGYWDPARGEYRFDVLRVVDDALDWTEMVPRVLEPTVAAGTTNEFGAAAVVGPGTGDNMAAALATALGRGDVAVSIGTSGTVSSVSDAPSADPSGAVAGFADATGRFLPLVCTLNATKVTDAFARLLGVDRAGFESLVAAAVPGAGGLVLIPYLDGERTPDLPRATGTLNGLRSDVAREQVARAAVEGVVCGLLDGLDALARAGVATDGRILLVGGGARAASYQQVLADLSGRPVLVPRATELVAAGACVQAAGVLHGVPLPQVAAHWGLGAANAVEPRADVDANGIRARYAAARDAVATAVGGGSG
jgi:xylulokinase